MASKQKRGLDDLVAQSLEKRAKNGKTLEEQLSVVRGEIESLQEAVSKEATQAKLSESALKDSRSEAEQLQAHNASLSQELSKSQERVASLEADLENARNAQERCEGERERLEYVLASNGQEGSVALSVFAADRDSLLYKMYSGDWDYPRDSRGRALITCHPDRWAAILEHLATGAIPERRDSLLLAQARYWNLQTLVNGLEALIPGVTVVADPDGQGFRARCVLCRSVRDSKMIQTL